MDIYYVLDCHSMEWVAKFESSQCNYSYPNLQISCNVEKTVLCITNLLCTGIRFGRKFNMDGIYTRVLLVTANVGSIFEDVRMQMS